MACGPLFANPRYPYRGGMDDILALPAGPLADASLAVVRASASEPIADHSIRSFLFARLLAEHEGCLNDAAYDEQLLFAATVMHDLGLGDHAQGQARFEVEGADLAAAVLRNQGFAEADVDRVWEAIALHACLGIADRRGLLTYLTHKGVFVDIGRLGDGVADRLRREVFNAYPKPADEGYLRDAIVKHASRSDAAAPIGSLAAQLLLQQRHMRARVADRASASNATETADPMSQPSLCQVRVRGGFATGGHTRADRQRSCSFTTGAARETPLGSVLVAVKCGGVGSCSRLVIESACGRVRARTVKASSRR